MILPVPENDSLFFLFHLSVKYNPPPNEYGYVDRLLYSIMKIKGNKKTVLEKNILLMVDSLSVGELNAVKHSNGKDWWIILPRRNSNQFYVFLLQRMVSLTRLFRKLEMRHHQKKKDTDKLSSPPMETKWCGFSHIMP